MPCRTGSGGLDVEGLGIVYLEASATGLTVIGGDSAGATRAGPGSSATGPGIWPRPGCALLEEPCSLRVERLDVAGALLGQHRPADAQLGGQLAGFLGEVGVEDPELADRLRAGHRQVGVVDRAL